MVDQVTFTLTPFKRGIHLITTLIEVQLPVLPESGLINIFLHHTSAALALNENADPTVRADFESFLDHLAPEGGHSYSHILEGSDDMPAHLKSSIMGQSLNIPVISGRMGLGTWQGIYLCEFRNRGGSRRITITVVC
ncbi:MAG: secondary thiamine-phosphate synthase enzyme YjbQ [Bacteroidales bacterium]